MRKSTGGIRGAMVLTLLWVIGWGLGFGGFIEAFIDPEGEIQDVWLTVMAVPGFIGGVIFSALLLTVERRSTFDQVPLARYALWGAVTGVLLGLLTIPAEVGDVSPGALGMIAILTPLGVVAAIGSALFFRLVARWTN